MDENVITIETRTLAMKLNLRGRILTLEKPLVMGILNVTPDSFSDGGKYYHIEKALRKTEEMIHDGASIIDIGGESTRPGSDPVDEMTERKRVMPVIEALRVNFPEMILSIDTTKYVVAKTALKAGVHLVNDVSGLRKEPRFAELCAETGAGYILMHSVKDPKTMQNNPEYEDVIKEMEFFFREGLQTLQREGVESVILDPGIGFGKKLKHNLEIIRRLRTYQALEKPILVGASRKKMIGEVLEGRPVEGRLSGTLAVHYHALMQGASILRVHDVKETADLIKLYCALKDNP